MAQNCAACGRENADMAKFCDLCGEPLSSPLLVRSENILVGKRYEILSTIKAGAMGCVYKAKDTHLNDIVALKKMMANYTNAEDKKYTEERFQEEARLLFKLNHNGLPKVSDVFTDNDPDTNETAHYIVMTFIEGKDLETVIKERGETPFPIEEVLAHTLQILDILKYLHSETPPIIYRDLNPRNIMLQNGRIFLVDFGIARIFTPLKKGTAIGTPGYAAPEQYKGFAEPRSDFYSLGAVMHYLLTGQDPEDSMRALFTFKPPREYNKKVPPHINSLIISMLDLNPDKRPGSESEISKKLNYGLAKSQAFQVISAPTPVQQESSTGDKNKSIFKILDNVDMNAAKKPVISQTKETGANKTLFYAISQGSELLVESLIKRGADVNAKDDDGWTPLLSAINKKLPSIAGLLIKSGADTRARGNNGLTPLHFAAGLGLMEIVALLIENGAAINAKDNFGGMPLHFAAANGFAKIVGLLIENSTDVNAMDNDGWNPLFFAVSQDSRIIAGMLIGNGADVNTKDNNAWTPLLFAINKRLLKMAELLIKNGADLNAKNNEGMTALHFAIHKDLLKTAKLLIKKGVNLNARDNNGLTPLHFAINSGSPGAIELLIKNGADLNARDNSGWTPFQHAASKGSIKIVEFLIENGASVSERDIERLAMIDAARHRPWWGHIFGIK